MVTLKVENGSHRGKAFKVHGGTAVVKAGQKATIENASELTDAQIEAFKRDRVKVSQSGKAGETKAETKKDMVKADDKPVEIPEGWAGLHHATRMKLARDISGKDVDDADAADAIIKAEAERRASA